jgi:hypothetical protein
MSNQPRPDKTPTPARGTKFQPPRDLKEFVNPAYYPFGTEWDTHHPPDTREGIIESLIKGVGSRVGSLLGPDMMFLEQYLHPQKDILPKTAERPTRTREQKMDYRAIPDSMFDKANLNKYFSDSEKPVLDLSLRTTKPPFEHPTMGLGGFTISEAPDYYSLYDIWDFDTASPLHMGGIGDALTKLLLQRMGRPYAVYNRIQKNDPRLVVTDVK